MDLFGWILLVVVSLWASSLAFVWGLRSGQFSEPDRARYLPLPEDLPPPPAQMPRPRKAQRYALIAISALVLLGMMAPMALLLWRLRG